MNRVKEQILALVPGSIDEAVSVNTLACRADVSHDIVRRHLASLQNDGRIDISRLHDKALYFRQDLELEIGLERERNDQKFVDDPFGADKRWREKQLRDDPPAPVNTGDAATPTPEPDLAPLADRILHMLPTNPGIGLRVLQIARELHTRPNTVSATLTGMIELHQVARTGEGQRGDPYVYHVPGDEEVDLEPPDEAELLAAPRGTSPLQAVDAIFDTSGGAVRVRYEPETECEATRAELMAAYEDVIADLETRRRDAEHDASVLVAAIELLSRCWADVVEP